MRFIVVNNQGLVVNVIEWDGAEYKAKDNHALIYCPVGDIGDSYDFETDILTKPDRTAKDPEV